MQMSLVDNYTIDEKIISLIAHLLDNEQLSFIELSSHLIPSIRNKFTISNSDLMTRIAKIVNLMKDCDIIEEIFINGNGILKIK